MSKEEFGNDINELVKLLRSGHMKNNIDKANEVAKRLGLTEEFLVSKGGGMLPLLILVGLALLSGCGAHCGASKKPATPDYK